MKKKAITSKKRFMRTISNCFCSSLILIFVSINASAQSSTTATQTENTDGTYKTAIGIRGGETSGFTLKHFTGTESAIEGIFGFWPDAFSITGLFEHYVNAGTDGLYWYYGGGGHVGFNTGGLYYASESRRYYYHSGETGIGIDGMLGIEYKIPRIPFAISLDLKPYMEITTMNRVYGSIDPGLGVKVAF
jgi:hypothetical protein